MPSSFAQNTCGCPFVQNGLCAFGTLAEGRIIKCISDVAGSMAHILGIAASVAFMFLMTVTALILASNISTMIR